MVLGFGGEASIIIGVAVELSSMTGIAGRARLSTDGSLKDMGFILILGSGDSGKSQGAGGGMGCASGMTARASGTFGSSSPCM